ncbi:protein phosphatase 2C domain-containing protein [Malacoplasma iowae]|uniref:Serine/threonine phosphatase, family 2C n=2 Tax=Malacoplasma iowae TaxID=2116 RepID=A0A084U2Y3_MALIO|nr:PP2C family serine/threonine-protein phosphatase [Malacoplasma iowae]VEU63363.1 Serine/threonine phosphatase stp [Mycoplasmopsis fermentans]EGZ31435.1 protein phosphatase [Malacoplasma iowae 695]KFB07319.1 serine/threonine phosphatase, family 2C [Malacoplasma iowae DK-CPA]QHG89644.1 serine/threonine-protein phosphatase [Malacoplasma iowae 695]WPL35571.1 serine/threonine-protein phosphatase [Malacoplasma iowae]
MKIAKSLNEKRIIFNKSDTGFIRKTNEDYAWSGTNSVLDSLLIVSDGVGSYEGSDKASEIVSKVFSKSFLSLEYISIDVKKWFEKNIVRAKMIMKEHIKDNGRHMNMATTLVLALIIKKEVHVFWIGDSRAYLIDKKEATQLTEDHNLLNHLLNLNLTHDEIMKYKKHLHSITNSISASTEMAQKYDYLSIPLKSNNFIFLASDGFYNFCQLNNLFDIISDDTNKEVITDELVSNAITNGSNDNISFSYFGLLKES